MGPTTFPPRPPLNQTVKNAIFHHIFHPPCFHPNQINTLLILELLEHTEIVK